MSQSSDNRRPFLDRLSAALDVLSWDAEERQRGRAYVLKHTESYVGASDWDEYFHAIAQVVALKSKDMSRKVGAVVVGRDNIILTTGYNGMPRGVREVPERVSPKEEKYRWITHAETNAIFNAARSGISLTEGTLYVTTFPCGACAQAIVQSGIRRLFTYGEYWQNDPNGYEKAMEILAEGQVLVDAPLVRAEDAQLRKAKRAIKPVTLPGAADNDLVEPTRSTRATGVAGPARTLAGPRAARPPARARSARKRG